MIDTNNMNNPSSQQNNNNQLTHTNNAENNFSTHLMKKYGKYMASPERKIEMMIQCATCTVHRYLAFRGYATEKYLNKYSGLYTQNYFTWF